MFKCEICGLEFVKLHGFSIHISKTHKIKIEEYYLKYINPEKGKCKICGKNTRFNNLRDGYNRFCGLKCSNNSIEVKNKKKEVNFEKTGYDYPMQNPKNKKKQKQTCFENSGFENPMQNPEIKEKRKKIYFEKTGYENSMQNPETREKSNQTYFEKTGYRNPSQNPEIKEKKKQTCLENSGYEYSMQNPETRERAKQTYFEKTGYDYPAQNPESRKKQQESTLKNNNGVHPLKLTYKKCLERYPDLVKIEGLIEGPNGEIMGHCKNSSCKNSKENGGYFDVSKYIRDRNIGINSYDTGHFYCCEECKHSCSLFGKSATELHNLMNENKEILYTQEEYSIWKEEVYYRQRIENNTEINFCEYCHATENLHVHHEVPQKIVPGYALDPDNGIVFCEDCHYEIGHETGTECSTGNLASKICK